jgi:amino-acid N-acetyltransferase
MLLSLRFATPNDWESIAAHLEASGLPLEGARDHLTNFTLLFSAEQLVGTAGLEVYGDAALLRSVAVNSVFQKTGLGSRLINKTLERARQLNMREIVLLTETAADYFPRFGFKPIPRAAVPASLRASAEFRGACPDSAKALHVHLEPLT